MKERIFDLIKWSVVIFIAATFFHVVYAKEDVNCDCNDMLYRRLKNFLTRLTSVPGKSGWSRLIVYGQ